MLSTLPSAIGYVAHKIGLPYLIALRGNYWSEIECTKQRFVKSPHKKLAFWYARRYEEKSFKNALLVLPICRFLESEVKMRYPNKKVEVLYSAINPKDWRRKDYMDLKHPCVGMLHNANIWGKVRGMFSMKRVVNALPNITFYWAGDGLYRDLILSEFNKFSNFKWLGKLDYPDEVRKYLSSIDLYVLPSGSDMSPTTLLEAQLLEVPSVATNVGGVSENIADGRSGFLVEPEDVDSWIEKIEILINDSGLSKHFGMEGRKFVSENFSTEKIACDFIQVLKNTIT